MANSGWFRLANIILLIGIMTENNKQNVDLTVTAFNVRSLRCAALYLNIIMNEADIVVLSEHRLYPSEMYKRNEINAFYEFVGKASHDLYDDALHQKPGHCGTAVGWKKKMGNKIRIVDNASD